MKSIPIIQYENIIKGKPDKYSIHVDLLEEQLAVLARKGYKTVSPNLYIDESRILQQDEFILTFDGGFLSHYQYVLPVLQRYHFRAVFFVPVGLIGGVSTWKDKRLSLMNIEDIFDVIQRGHELGILSSSHVDLTEVEPGDLDMEIVEPKTEFEKRLNCTISYFAYPFGHYNQTAMNKVRTAGYKVAFAGDQILTDDMFNPFALRRVIPPYKKGFLGRTGIVQVLKKASI